ncbi:hypothetical protein HZ326_21322 [Fusarium oxysporum f. sp. albedinis]|nr:hypothetical protein HZ326_21322 [Fusarium oxysporum f. sp. albedinis]
MAKSCGGGVVLHWSGPQHPWRSIGGRVPVLLKLDGSPPNFHMWYSLLRPCSELRCQWSKDQRPASQ